MTKSDARTLIRQLIDDPSAKRWTDTNMDLLANATLDELWGEVLDEAPWLKTQSDEVALTSPGYFDTRLVADGGVLSKRFSKLQGVWRDDLRYTESRAQEMVEEADGDTLHGDPLTYVKLGDRIYLFDENGECNASGTVVVRYNYFPTGWTASTTIEWPTGHDMVYVYEIAGRMMRKGGAEDPRMHLTMAADAKQKLMSAVKHMSVGPQTMHAMDEATEWGSSE